MCDPGTILRRFSAITAPTLVLLLAAPCALALTAQTITGFAPATPVVYATGLVITLSATGGGSGNPVVFASTTPAVCTVSGAIAKVIAAGTCTLTANQAGNATYSAAKQVSKSIVVNKAAQTIAFDPVAGAALTQSPLTVRAVATSGLAVTVTSGTTTICKVTGFSVTLLKTGTCTLRANQAGNGNYSAAAQVSLSFAIQASAPTVRIDAPANNTTLEAPATIPFTYTTFVPAGSTLSRIMFFQNGVQVGSIAPGTGFVLRNLGVGSYNFTASATDNHGVTGTSAPVLVTVTPIAKPVSASLSRADPGANLDAPATIALISNASTRTPGASVARVDFYNGATLLGATTVAPYTFTWRDVPAGSYALTAIATDSNGATGTSPVLRLVVDGPDSCDATSLAASTIDTLPLGFEENAGQTDPAVKLLARGHGFQFFLTDHERMIALRPPRPLPRAQGLVEPRAAGAGVAIRMRFIGANRNTFVTGEGRLAQQSNYLVGDDPAHWQTGVAHFAKARYRDLYPGIDEVHYGQEGLLESDLIVTPGADPDAIRLAIDGVADLALGETGDLLLQTDAGTLVQKRPVAYQEFDGMRREVAARYRIEPDRSVTFALGDYDRSRALVIDPVLVYSTLLGGSDRGTHANAVGLSRCGEVFVAGSTFATDFPTTPGAFNATGPHGGASLGFVSKLNRGGSGLVYSTYLSSATGVGDTSVLALAVDGAGRAHVAGTTLATDFPTTPGSPIPTKQPDGIGFVAKLNKSGNALVHSTYFYNDVPIEAIAVDGVGNISFAYGSYVELMYPDGSGKGTIQAGALPSPQQTVVKALAADAAGNLFAAGTTSAQLLTTPGAFQSAYPADPTKTSGFVKRYGFGDGFGYSTFLGTTAATEIRAIAVDDAGNAYLTGTTGSGGSLPGFTGSVTTFNAGPANAANVDAFVAKLSPQGSQLQYFSRIGGANCQSGACTGAPTRPAAIAVDAGGRAWVAGTTQSNQIPLVNALRSQFSPAGSGPDLFALRLAPAGSSLEFSTLLDGRTPISSTPYVYDTPGAVGIAIDGSAAVFVAGNTDRSDFPTTAGALKTTLGAGAGSNAFVIKLGEPDATSTMLAIDPSPAAAGASVVLSAAVTGSAPGGNVTFMDGSHALGMASLVAASGSYVASVATQFASGTHWLKAVYGGDAHNGPSGSPTVRLVVDPPQTGVPSPPSLVSIVAGQSSLTLSFVAPTNNGGSAITGYAGRCSASGWDPLESTCRHASLSIL